MNKYRLAPTPSGYLHLGNIYNFLLTEEMALKDRALLGLRIDDFDRLRVREEYIEDIFEQISWLGIELDFGPKNKADFYKNYSCQLKRDQFFSKLSKIEKKIVCSCSRKEIEKRSGGREYDGYCVDKKLEFEPGKNSIRLDDKEFGFPVLWTKDDFASYQLQSVIDDLELGVTNIVRGEDLIESSDIQRKVAIELGEDFFNSIEFKFHPLIVNQDGTKFSKSNRDQSIKNIREQGISKEDIRKGFSQWRKSF